MNLQLLVPCLVGLKEPIHDQKIRQYIEAKNWYKKFWLYAWPCVGVFFVKKYIDLKYWRIKYVWYILTTLQYLTRVWAPVKILIKNSVLRWTFSQNQSYGNGSIRIKHFQHNEFWSKFWWNVCGQYGVKNLIKNWASIFCFKILTFFLIVYGAL